MVEKAVCDLRKLSESLILDSQYPTGAFPASPANSHYRVCWLRDGFWIAESMIATGHLSTALRFYSWAYDVVMKHAWKFRLMATGNARPDQVLHPRFDENGNEIQGEWAWHQLDAVSALLFGFSKLMLMKQIDAADAVKLLSRYIEDSWVFMPQDHSVWEEEKAMHLSSVSVMVSALEMSSKIVRVRHHIIDEMKSFIKSERKRNGIYFDHERKHVDFSVLNAWSFGAVGSMDFLRTAKLLESRLGRKYGLIRYPADRYFSFNNREGQWPLGRLWLSWYWHQLWKETGKERFFRRFRKNMRSAMLSISDRGFIPEQVMPEGAETVYDAVPLRDGRFGNAVATPLLWAHAMLLISTTNHSINELNL